MPRKRYMKEQKVYQKYMGDQEKHEQKEQKKFPEQLRKCFKDILNIRKRLRLHRCAVKPGSSPPRQPPCCPCGDKEQPKTTCRGKQNKKENHSNEGLGVYECGQMSRFERYRARLWDPTSKEARQKKVACEEARCSSTATNYTSSVAPDEVDADMQRLLQQVQVIEWRNTALVASLGMKPCGVRREHPGEPWEEGHRVGYSSPEGVSGGGKSLGTTALKGTN